MIYKITTQSIKLAHDQGLRLSVANTILNPGKFEGEHVSVLYFYDQYMNGDQGEFINNDVVAYRLNEKEKQEFDGCPTYLLEFQENGFVCCEWCPSPIEDLQDAEQ